MTAINIVTFADCALMTTDAVVSRDGRIVWIGTKVIRFPHLSAAVAVTGAASAGIIADCIDGFLGHVGSFDELVSILPRAVSEAMEFQDEAAAEYGGWRDPFDVHATGWSDSAGSFKVFSCSWTGAGSPAVVDAGRVVLQPGAPDLIERLHREGLAPEVILESPGPAGGELLAGIMRQQRAWAAERGEVIGGFQELTVIQRGLTLSSILDLWPERVGDQISQSPQL